MKRTMNLLRCSCCCLILALAGLVVVQGWTTQQQQSHSHSSASYKYPTTTRRTRLAASAAAPGTTKTVSSSATPSSAQSPPLTRVTIVGAGWGGLSAAHALSLEDNVKVTVVEACPAVGGLVRDGFLTTGSSSSKKRPAEAGQHGFWNNYHNIYRLLRDDLGLDLKAALTDYAEQGQWSPKGLEAIWPVYQEQAVTLPTGLAQAAYTRFTNLPLQDLATALPLVLAFSEFDDSDAAWLRYDDISFKSLCTKLGVSKRCYNEAFEPMILTGLFAPGRECSAAAALGMAYFFVLQSQAAFDVQWCRGNVGDVIFSPWVKQLKEAGVEFQCSTRVTGFDMKDDSITTIRAETNGKAVELKTDKVVLAVGAKALNAFVKYSPELSAYSELRRFANLRGTSVLATRLFLDQNVTIQYTANACWGFDEGVGMTMFDIKAIHGVDAPTVAGCPGSVVEVDYYHANSILVLSDDEIIAKAKKDLDNLLGIQCERANVVDAAVVRLPEGVNWYYPGSYKDMPDLESSQVSNLFFAGDIVRTRHGSWSQEKAFVTGKQVANRIVGNAIDDGVIPMSDDEPHVKLGRDVFAKVREVLGGGNPSKGPSLVDFFW